MDVGVYTLGEIKSQASRFVQDPTETFIQLLEDEINDCYLQLAQKMDIPELRGIYKDTISFTSGQPKFYCPIDVAQPIALLDGTNNRYIEKIGLDQLIYVSPSTFDANAGVITCSSIADEGKSIEFSATPETIQIASSSSADTSKSCFFSYKNTNGNTLQESITTNSTNGTTAVVSSATLSDLIRFSSSSTRVGVITVTGSSSGNVYARLGPLENAAVYKVLYLSRVPDAGNTAVLVYKKAILRMQDDKDVPVLPVSHYLRRYAIAFGLEFDGKEEAAQTHYARAEEMLADFINQSQAQQTVVQANPRIRPSSHSRRYWGWRYTGA